MGRSGRPRAKANGFPKVLAEVYGDRVRNLRQLILQLLGPSLGLEPCQCNGLCDEHVIYCARCDPSGYLLRDDDNAEYWSLLECSYAVVSNQAPALESFTLEQRWTQRQILERVIELQFRRAIRPLNVICFGYRQSQPNNIQMNFTPAPYGLESTSFNSVTRLLTSPAWMVLLSRVGDMFMLHLLSHSSVFYPLPNDSYLQVTGAPISSLVSSSEPYGSMQNGQSVNNYHFHGNTASIERCRTSGFCTQSECSYVRTQSPLKEFIHRPVPVVGGAKVPSMHASNFCEERDKAIPLTEATGFCLSLPDSAKNRVSNYGYEKAYKGGEKRRFLSDHLAVGNKKTKGNGYRRLCRPNEGGDSACAVSPLNSTFFRFKDNDQHGSATKTAARNFFHVGQMSTETRPSDRTSKNHSESGSIHLPGTYSSRNNKCPACFWSGSESDMVRAPSVEPEWGGKVNIVQNCSKLENIPLETHHSSSCNAPKNVGISKKRARPFSWQRRKKCRFQEKIFSLIEAADDNCRLEDGMIKESSTHQRLHSFSPSDLGCPCGINRNLMQCGIIPQHASLSVSEKDQKIVPKKSDETLVFDEMISLESDTLLFSAQADGQKVGLLPCTKGIELSSTKDRHETQAGIVHRVCLSSCCKGHEIVNADQNLCAVHGHVCYFRNSSLCAEKDHKRHLMRGRKCIPGSSIIRDEKFDNALKAISEIQTQDGCKIHQSFAPESSQISEKLYSHPLFNPSSQLGCQESVKSKLQGMLLSNRAKVSTRSLCWLMLQTQLRDPSHTLINRRPLFYNSGFSCYAGLPRNHILNAIKPSNSGAAHLLGLIFGVPDTGICDSCSSHEKFIGGAVALESPSEIQSLLYLLKDLIRNAQHCNYARLLSRHSPAQFKKQSNEDSSRSLSKMTDLLQSEDFYQTQDKETLPNLHKTAGKNNMSVLVDSTSNVHAIPRNLCARTENNCSIHTKHSCSNEEFHTTGSFQKYSSVQRLVVRRKHKHDFFSGINDNANGWDLNHATKVSDEGGKARKLFPSPSRDPQNELIKSCTSHKDVVSFIWAVCRRIIPETLLGSKSNWRALRSNIAKFVNLRRHEKFSLQQCLYKLKTSHFPWLNGITLVCEHFAHLSSLNDEWKGHKCLYDRLEKRKGWTCHDSIDENKVGNHSWKMLLQQKMLANWTFWLFSSLIVPLIRAHFYVTESENGRQNVFYYRKYVWTKILNGAVKKLCRSNYKRLSAGSLARILQKRSIGFSQIRFLPKETGLRPIANLGAPSATWLPLQKNLGKTSKGRKGKKLASNLLILDGNSMRKNFKQKCSFDNNPPTSSHNVLSKHSWEARKGDKAAALGYHPYSDKARKGIRNLCGSDSQVRLSFRPVNSLLCDSHYCVKLEQKDCPEDLGCSVFDYNDIYLKIMPFVLSLKGFCLGMPQLYIVVCDVAKAFDTINQDKLLSVIQNIVRKEEYLICRYTKVARTTKSIKVSHERTCVPQGKDTNFINFLDSLAAKYPQCIFIDQAFFRRIKQEQLLTLMREHIKRNILRIGPHFYIQKVGIPQGSVLSALLCSFYYGYLDRNIILPLLRHNEIKNTIDSPQKGFEDHRVSGDSLKTRVLNEARVGAEVNTIFYEERDKISGFSTRHSRKMRIVQDSKDLGPCKNGQENKASNSILVACSSNNQNGLRNCTESPKSLLLRMIDDSILISTSKKEAFCFIATMHRGFKEYNCYANEHKTSLNFDMELEGKNLAKNIYKTEDGASFMQWNGLLINCHTLEIQADYTRYWGAHISSTLTVWGQKNPGYHLMAKLCQFMRPKCHPIFYDSNINSPATVRLNAYQAFLLCAMKFHAYVSSMPSVGGCSPRYFFQAIMKSTRYMYKLIKQRMYNIGLKSNACPNLLLQHKEMEWLGLSAYNKVLQKKHSRHKQLLAFLGAKLLCSKYQDLVTSANLHLAVDDSRSSMFWKIRY